MLVKVIDYTLTENKAVEFRLVGFGADGTRIIKLLVKKHPRNVRHLGFITDAQLRSEYTNSDLLISTSRYETPGLTILEAQAHGIPVVAFRVPGPKDIIKKGFQGSLVEPFDMTGFAKEIIKYSELSKSPSKYSHTMIKIQNEIKRRYSEKQFVERFTRMINEASAIN